MSDNLRDLIRELQEVLPELCKDININNAECENRGTYSVCDMCKYGG